MTEAQTRRYYDLNMLRDEKLWIREIRKMFAAQLRGLMALIAQAKEPKTIIEGLPLVINSTGTMALYQRLYQTQGEKYYTVTQEAMTGQKRKAIKKLDPTDPYFMHMAGLVESLVGYRVRTIQETSREFAIQAIQDATEIIQEQGLGIQEGTKLIEEMVNAEWRRTESFRAARIARTEVGTLSNMASDLGARNTGLDYKKRWLAYMDNRTRATHAQANGQEVVKGQSFQVGDAAMKYPSDPTAPASEVINCYLPNTVIESNITQGQKSNYSGQAIEIITRTGKRLSITANHPILTEKGFVAANLLKKGDKVISQRLKTGLFSLFNNYVKQKVLTAANIFSSIKVFSVSEFRMPVALDFNGDGEFFNSNIEIIYPKIFLNLRSISNLRNNFAKFFFVKASFMSSIISGFSSFYFFRSANKPSFSRLMCFLYLSFSLLFRHKRPFHRFSFRLAPKLDSMLFEDTINNIATNPLLLSEFVNTNSRQIIFDDIIDIREYYYSGHVYDFSSINGANIANNIYTSNCRCVAQYVVAEFTIQ